MNRQRRLTLAVGSLLAVTACLSQPEQIEREIAASSAEVRAARRAYDGAPPVIPHDNLGTTCAECHDERGVNVPGLGYAPAQPHNETSGVGETARCRQCHVFAVTGAQFVGNSFVGVAQAPRSGARATDGAPPTMPHRLQMRENCVACHTGPAARTDIVSEHPERENCKQCHVEVAVTRSFVPPNTAGVE